MPKFKPWSRNSKISITGLMLIFIILIISGENIEIKPLLSLQQNGLYKQFTGLIMFGFILYQWHFAFARKDRTCSVKDKLFIHKMVGLLMPILLFIHTMQYGYAYQTLIWGIFVTHCTIGFLNPDFLKLKHPSLRLFWFAVHIGLSVMVSGLLFYHLYVVYYYA